MHQTIPTSVLMVAFGMFWLGSTSPLQAEPPETTESFLEGIERKYDSAQNQGE